VKVIDHMHECIFCSAWSDDFESNMKHMYMSHGFFIPDNEFCSDRSGMIQYLGEKVTVAFVCLYCNLKGKRFQSCEAARGHMIDKGHCKVLNDDKEFGEEFEEFFDYSKDESALAVHPDVDFSETGELILNGKHVGTRDLKIYYKQKPAPVESREEVLEAQLALQYRHLHALSPKEMDTRRQNLHVARKEQSFRLRVGMRGNNMKHFRDPTMTC